MFTGLLTLAALVFGATFAAGAFSSDRARLGPAQEKSDVLIDYRRTGGYAGEFTRLVVRTDGSAILGTGPDDGPVSEKRFVLPQAGLEQLKDAVADIDWLSAAGSYDLPAGVGVADGFMYELEHDGHVVSGVSGAEPPDVAVLIQVLDALLDAVPTDEVQDGAECGPPVDFEPTYLPDGWSKDLQRGSGDGQDFPGLVGHYGSGSHRQAGYFDMFAGHSPLAQSNRQRMDILGRPATSGDIHEGYSVEFEYEGCTYVLIAYVFERSELERFAEGLRPSGDNDRRSEDRAADFAAIWPEDTYEHAAEECTSEAHKEDSWRADPESIALEFGALVLGWEEPSVMEVDDPEAYNYDGVVLDVRRDPPDGGHGPVSALVRVWTFESAPDCWSIGSVSRVPDNEPTGVSVSVDGRVVQIGFDTLDAAGGSVEVGYGGRDQMKRWVEAEATERPVTFELGFDPATTGHFLILFEDQEGQVFSASGGPLAAGDFAAG
jgi:hypothetical protein